MTRKKIKQRMVAMLALDSHPGHIAAGFAVGVFISVTPLFGLHTPLAIMFAFLFRLNKLTTITGAWVNTPLTVIPVLMASYRLGEFILGQPPQSVSFHNLGWHHLREYASALFIGSSIIGLIMAVLSYGACYWLVIQFRRKDPGLAELTHESLIAGEDLELEKAEDKE
jgi:uncharacterized protein (DUF2062 family)